MQLLLTKNEYHKALQELEFMLEVPNLNESEMERINYLVDKVVEYEDFFYPIARPSLFSIIAFRIDQMGFWNWLKSILLPKF